jgi:hypothetical protein
MDDTRASGGLPAQLYSLSLWRSHQIGVKRRRGERIGEAKVRALPI